MILFDATQAFYQATGIGRYAKKLAEELKHYPAIAFLSGPVSKQRDRVSFKLRRLFWEQIQLPWEVFCRGAHLTHLVNNLDMPLWRWGKEYIITLHDIIPLHFPEVYFKNYGKYLSYRARLWWTVHAAKKIVTVSAYSKEDILKHFALDEGKVEVVYLGIDTTLFHPWTKKEREMARTHWGWGSFVLGIGGDEPRKNVARLVTAFSLLREKFHYRGELFIVGGVTGRLGNDLPHVPKVRYLGRVTDETLIALYHLADLFVFPSLYEGFGLPPLEAMACGTPVAASDSTSLPEVLEDAAEFFDPKDVEALAEAMHRVLDDEARRDFLCCRGQEIVGRYSWAAAAARLVSIYQDCGAAWEQGKA